MKKEDFFKEYHEDVKKLSCIPEELEVNPENIVDICINFFSKLITIQNKARPEYFNNIGKKNLLIKEFENNVLEQNFNPNFSKEEEKTLEIGTTSNIDKNIKDLKNNQHNKEVFEYIEKNKKYDWNDKINLDGFIINNKKDILNYLIIKQNKTFENILSVERNERVANKPFLTTTETNVGGGKAMQKKLFFYVDPRKTSRYIWAEHSTYTLNEETIEDALNGQLFKFRNPEDILQRRNQFVNNFLKKWDFKNSDSTFLKNLKREFLFDKLTNFFQEKYSKTFNFSDAAMTKIRNLYNLFLNKHNTQISTLFQNVLPFNNEEDFEFDSLYKTEIEKKYPEILTTSEGVKEKEIMKNKNKGKKFQDDLDKFCL